MNNYTIKFANKPSVLDALKFNFFTVSSQISEYEWLKYGIKPKKYLFECNNLRDALLLFGCKVIEDDDGNLIITEFTSCFDNSQVLLSIIKIFCDNT